MKLNKMGERAIIDRIFSTGNISQEPDDCSLMDCGDKYILFTTDSISEKVHIPELATPYEAGRFFGSINLSDVAAMAGIPESFMASYNLKNDMEIEYLSEFSRGLSSLLHEYKVEFVGGDTKEAEENIFVGFCIGRQEKDLVRKRSYIGPDQILCLTGNVGKVGAAYISYKNGIDVRESSRRMLDIKPRLDVAEIISRAGARFMMDLSDGLFGCLSQMKHDYGYGFRIVEHEVRMHGSVDEISKITGMPKRDIAMNIGGDYELLFTIDNDHFGEFSREMETNNIDISYIGNTWNGNNIIFDGERWENIEEKGWEHFSIEPDAPEE